jgi:hypothetical protein
LKTISVAFLMEGNFACTHKLVYNSDDLCNGVVNYVSILLSETKRAALYTRLEVVTCTIHIIGDKVWWWGTSQTFNQPF